MQQTIFERIIAREIPSTIEFEDDRVIAIRDIAPSAPVHVLIIPKRVIRNVDDLAEQDAELIGHVFLVARDLARKYGVVDNGYRIVTNCNEHAGQTVFHLHFHLLAGEPLGRMNSPPDPP
ncbi:MAG: histidine triad nucleotide-binding protein [Bacteroidota bacterium]